MVLKIQLKWDHYSPSNHEICLNDPNCEEKPRVCIVQYDTVTPCGWGLVKISQTSPEPKFKLAEKIYDACRESKIVQRQKLNFVNLKIVSSKLWKLLSFSLSALYLWIDYYFVQYTLSFYKTVHASFVIHGCQGLTLKCHPQYPGNSQHVRLQIWTKLKVEKSLDECRLAHWGGVAAHWSAVGVRIMLSNKTKKK